MTNARADLLARQDEAIAQAIEAEIEANIHAMASAAVAVEVLLHSLQADTNKRNKALQAKADAARAGTWALPPASQLPVLDERDLVIMALSLEPDEPERMVPRAANDVEAA